MPILLDGNNLLHRLPNGSRSRAEVRRRVLDATRHERMAVTIVFDGPPPTGAPEREALGRVTVVYSNQRRADDVIIERLPAGAAVRNWIVVTDDRALARRARELGARVHRLDDWRARRSAPPRRPTPEAKLSAREIDEWEDYFASGRDRQS